MNEKINKEKEEFVITLKNMSTVEKKKYHYHSVINLSNGLILLNNNDSHQPFKELILEYFNLIKELNYLVSQKESLIYYKKYILPIGQHLTKHSGFRTKWDILKYIIAGIVVDFMFFYFFKSYYFIATPILFFIGYLKQKKIIREKKLFSINW